MCHRAVSPTSHPVYTVWLLCVMCCRTHSSVNMLQDITWVWLHDGSKVVVALFRGLLRGFSGHFPTLVWRGKLTLFFLNEFFFLKISLEVFTILWKFLWDFIYIHIKKSYLIFFKHWEDFEKWTPQKKLSKFAVIFCINVAFKFNTKNSILLILIARNWFRINIE